MFAYIGVLVDLLALRVRAARSDDRRELGASAIEWAIIAAIAVVIATVVGTAIYNFVGTKDAQLNNCANQPVGTACK